MRRIVPTILVLLLSLSPAALQGQAPGPGVPDFVLSPGDRLRISVWPDSTLSGVFPVEESGMIHLPLLGAREAAGKTVAAFREELRAGYAEDLQLPVVSLEAEFRVSVLGAVRAPGVYWVNPTYGVFDLLSRAGGFQANAKEDQIVMTRAGGESYRIDAERLQDARSGESLLTLRSGDRLVVPEGGWWDWRVFLQSLTLAATVVGIAVR
ncbi:MAG: polysaccharide biosynthesis/export family protein [Longimicrobiales bacterium]|nr:polysaccharide biosynthesis/export family protein [Longimicrobiales bacterium]